MDNLSEHFLVKNKQELNKVLGGKDYIIALIYASWCPYCTSFLPVFMKYAHSKEGFLLVEDDRWVVADKYEVEVVPSVLYFENGEVVKRLNGTLGVGLKEKDLTDFIGFTVNRE